MFYNRVGSFLQVKNSIVVLTGISLVFITLGMLSPVVSAATGTQFVAYQINGSTTTRSISAVVNESVTPSSTSGFSSVTLQLVSNMANLSYSKIVNSSKVMFPYFPGFANQSLSFQYHNLSIAVSLAQVGSESVTFNSQTYTLTKYDFNVSGSKTGGTPMSASGHFSVFPSGLVYSATVTANATNTIHVQLLGTNLDLNATARSSSQATSIAVAGGGVSILAGVGAFVLYRRKNNSANQGKTDAKPLYHVD
ncbi:MAG: hypothetical protein OK457_10615 [Thaumarchaeota archaeon]|nr:hypothetical protein [Nitrososphaerota archaeon]